MNELNKKSKDYYTVESFEIKKFLEEFNTDIKLVPKHTEATQSLNVYPKDWNKISMEYRTMKKWRCEKCGKDMINNTEPLDVHHIDGNKQNVSPSNLQALCRSCHIEEHPHMKGLRR